MYKFKHIKNKMFKFLTVCKGSFSILSGGETIFSSRYRWIFHLKDKKIVFFTDIEHTLWVVYYSPDRFMCSTFCNNVERVSFMADSNSFFVIGKDETTSFYSITNIIEQIDRSMSPVIAPILSSNAVLVGGRYVSSYTRVGASEVDVQIFDSTMQQIFVSFRMLGTQVRGCQLIQDDSVFFIYTDVECLYISVNREILLRAPVEIIGNFIFVQKKIEHGFEVYLFDIRKNDVVHHFRIGGDRIEFNHVLTMDDSSMVFRASSDSSELDFIVDETK
jgi:hypothetical protein